MNMKDAGIIIQIIVSTATFISVLLGFVYAWLENKKNKYVEIITSQTIKNMLFLRENSALFSAFIRPEFIADAKNSLPDYKIRLMQAATNIECIMKYRFDKEREIINIVRETTKLCFDYFDEPTEELDTNIRALGDKFYNLMSLYDYSDWLYIKAQARSKPYKKDFPDYDKIYDTQKGSFAQSEKPMPW